MGCNVEIYGNHTVCFKNNSIFGIANEIKNKLNNINFSNNDFLLYYSLFDKYFNNYSSKEIENMKLLNKWDYYENVLENEYNECGYINFHGYYNLKIYFYEKYIIFADPNCRFISWCEYGSGSDFVNEWRKYYKQIINEFGGNRIIYYPDYGIDGYSGILSELPFDEFEKEYFKTIEEQNLTDWDKEYFKGIKFTSELFDKLDNIDWAKNYSLNEWKPIERK